MDDQKQIELRSDDVQEILGTPPGWLVRWGSTVALMGFCMLLIAGWIVRYPDVIPARIILTTSNPPVEVVARADGPIAAMLVQDAETVSQGQALIVLSSTAKFEHVEQLDRSVATWQKLSQDSLALLYPITNLELGDIQADYSTFLQNLESFRFGKDDKSRSLSSDIASINGQINRLQQGITLDQRSKQRALKTLENERELYSNYDNLYRQGVVSRVTLEQARQKVSDAERAVDQFDESILRKQNEIAGLRKSMNETSSSEREDDVSLSVKLRESLNALRGSIDRWKQSYLLTSPVDGKVSFNAAYYSTQQYVKTGELVLTVVPPTDSRIIGRLTLPAAGSGKVKPGQRVVVKLDSYPFHEFGTVEGTVATKALVPKDNQYNIIINFPPKLLTNYKKPIPFEQQLQGSAEIVTEDKRFLERIMEQIFAVGR